MRAIGVEWLESNGLRARLLGIVVLSDGSLRFHVKVWVKGQYGRRAQYDEQFWTFEQLVGFNAKPGETFNAAQEAGLE